MLENPGFCDGFPLCARFYAKSAKRAKNVPTWSQYAEVSARIGSDLGELWPPLVRKSSMLMQAFKAVGSNTPGAASSAADLAPTWRPKTLQNRGRNPKKTMVKNDIFLTSTFSRSCVDLGGSWASKLEPNWPSWGPRTLPKVSKSRSFWVHVSQMLPKRLQSGSKGIPRRAQRSIFGAFSMNLGAIFP